jgi:thioredoxin 1
LQTQKNEKERIMTQEINDAAWDSEVLQSSLPVLVDVHSTHCSPCRALAPVIDKLASDFEGRAKVVKLNTDHNQEVAGSLKVSAVPTVLLFEHGREVGRLVGLRPEPAYRKLLEAAGVS